MRARQITGWILVGLLAALGVFIYFGIYGFSFSAYICFGVAFVLALYQLLGLLAVRHKRAAKALRLILSTFLGLGLLLCAATGIRIAAADTEAEAGCDYIIVLGCGLRGSEPSLILAERIYTAAAYLKNNPETVCIVSGGQGSGEDMTEAQCMYNLLVEEGIDPGRIRMEPQATSTWENLVLSKKIIQEEATEAPDKIGIVSSEFHLFRAGLMARELGVEPVLIGAQTPYFAVRVNYFLREIPGVWYYLIFGGN